MPKFIDANEDMQVDTSIGGYQFSGAKVDKLATQASEFTVVTLVVDTTGSTQGFEHLLNEMVINVIKSFEGSQYKDQLLIRVINFDSKIYEVHGFKTFNMIDIANDYPDFRSRGATALYDAVDGAIDATIKYTSDLYDQDYDTNGIIIIVTDGMDISSVKASPQIIKSKLDNLVKNESKIDSLITLLIGINTDSCDRELKRFQFEAGLTEYISAGDATPETIGKITNYVSQSISSQSESLATGVPSQNIQF